MIKAESFYKNLKDNGINFFAGVPDSLLKSFCAYVKDNTESDKNITAANEGNAIALACGHYLASGQPGVVYMQNSGLGNIINPLASLADKLVYNIPVLLIVGWRGEPGKKDEPQHKKQGLITTETLDLMGVKYKVVSSETSDEEAAEIIKEAAEYMKETSEPYGIVVKKGAFEEYKLKNNRIADFEMKREEAVEILTENMEEDAVIVSTTGMASRELFEIRERRKEGHKRDFLTVGSMGHASQIALGIALSKKDRSVYCLDGDGALIMHLGGLAIIGSSAPSNYRHILINNGAHDSVGGQDTAGFDIDAPAIARACGYKEVYSCSTREELIENLNKIKNADGPVLLEVKVTKGARKDLGRPTTTPVENKNAFMEFLK